MDDLILIFKAFEPDQVEELLGVDRVERGDRAYDSHELQRQKHIRDAREAGKPYYHLRVFTVPVFDEVVV